MMTNRWRWAGGLVFAVALAWCSAGCGRSSQVLAPDAGISALDAAVTLAPDDAEPARDRGTSEEHRRATSISGPATITLPGDYRLTEDIRVAQGDAIVITASHVRLWLGEHQLYGPGNKAGRAVVIDGAEDVVVHGGRIEHFGFGAVLMNASRCRVEDLTIRGGDETADPANGNPPQIGIMLVNSAMNYIAENRMRNVNLGIFVRGGRSYANRIHRNEVISGEHGLLAICYNPASGEGPAGPHADRVSQNLLARFGTGISASAQSAENYFVLNTIRYFTTAYADQNGTNVFEHNRAEQIAP